MAKRSTTALTKEQQIDHILEQLEEKRSLSKICAEDAGMPRVSSFLAWVAKDATLAERYSHAREAQITKMLEETLDIADNATDDAYIWEDPKTKRQYARLNGDSVKRAALRINARERFAQLMAPERFNTSRTDITSGGKALPAPQANDNRIVALLTLAAQRASELNQARAHNVIDVTPLSLDDVMNG